MEYNRQLVMAILHDKVQIAKKVNATMIPLDEARSATRRSTRAPPRSTSLTHTAQSPDQRTLGGAGPSRLYPIRRHHSLVVRDYNRGANVGARSLAAGDQRAGDRY
jgi:hypothetical protein